MTPHSEGAARIPAWVPGWGVALLALVSSLTGLRNDWVQDDRPIIVLDATLHTLARPWRLFMEAYWPAPFPRELYRPLTSTLLAGEWVIGGGRTIVFRIVSTLLYVLATVAVYRLARRLLQPGPAWLAAALFAVHPVHVEAVAVAVNQAELVVGLLMCLLATTYLDRRRSARPITAGWMAGMGAAYLAASLFKESALVLPGLFVALELTVIADPRPWRERLTALRPLLLVMMLSAACVIGVRNIVLAGNTTGTFTAEALFGLGLGGRTLTMLGVVPEWIRLFVWPEHLRAEYSPQEISTATTWGTEQTLGLALLVAIVMIAWIARHKRPVVTLGILWIGIALFPVSNVLVPTGIALAERTLFMATIGVVLAGADACWAVGSRVYAKGAIARIAVVSAMAVVLGMGLTRSMSRYFVWHDLPTLWRQTLIDAPKSYRAHHAYGQILFAGGMRRSAEHEYHLAMQYYPPAWPVPLDLADKYRLAGDCYPAIRLYQHVLVTVPDHAAARASLVACLMLIGDYAAASRQSRLGASYGTQSKSFMIYAALADSAERVKAKPGTVHLPPPVDSIVP